MRIEVFESISYGIQGLTDTTKDKEALRFKEDLNRLKLEDKEIEVLIYKVDVYGARPKNIGSLMNIDGNKFVKEMSNKKLPIIFINDEVFRYGEYPAIKEVKSYIQSNKQY